MARAPGASCSIMDQTILIRMQARRAALATTGGAAHRCCQRALGPSGATRQCPTCRAPPAAALVCHFD